MIDYIEKHNKIVAKRDEDGIFHVRIDYMANGDKVKFFIDGDKEFVVTKKLLRKDSHNITYTITVENIGFYPIEDKIVLYSDNSGVFPQYSLFRHKAIGNEASVSKLNPGKKAKFVFFTWQIETRDEALRLIKDVPNNEIYGHKVLSVFERLNSNLTDDYELFLEGLKYSEYVGKYASERLKRRLAKEQSEPLMESV